MTESFKNMVYTQTVNCQSMIDASDFFYIPTYQRPYVWGKKQIYALLEDIKYAYDHELERYYIGATLLKKNEKIYAGEKRLRYELIDGQQRTTTLILIALACYLILKLEALKNSESTDQIQKKQMMSRCLELIHSDGQLRLTFPIRDTLNQFFCDILKKDLKKNIGPILDSEIKAAISKDEQSEAKREAKEANYLLPILTALKLIVSWLQQDERFYHEDTQKEGNKDKFIDYFLDKVEWVSNTLPQGSNPSQIFKVVNTSGLQLEQHDILKAMLLAKLNDEVSNERDFEDSGLTNNQVFTIIWETCAGMGNYLIHNILKRPEFTTDQFKAVKDIVDFHDIRQFLRNIPCAIKAKKWDEIDLNEESQKRVYEESIVALFSKSRQLSGQLQDQNQAAENQDDSQNVESIITFSQLLLHTYRIYRQKKGNEDFKEPFTEENLNKIFVEFVADATPSKVMDFIELLWKVRYQFDRYVIKRNIKDHKRGNDFLLIKKQTYDAKDNTFKTDGEEEKALAQLQSYLLLSFDRKAQYWLTPFLAFLLDQTAEHNSLNGNEEKRLHRLEYIDDTLSLLRLATSTNDRTVNKSESFNLIGSEIEFASEENREALRIYLNLPHGTSFTHYWFRRLEYYLWKNREKEIIGRYINDDQSKMLKERKEVDEYRILSRNSIEHIYPQNPQHTEINERLEDEISNAFGNLVLLSVSENSCYSNASIESKLQKFKENTLTSLKQLCFFSELSVKGTDKFFEVINVHRDNMIEILIDSYKAPEAQENKTSLD